MSDEQIYGFMPFNHADRPVEAMVGETAYDYNGKVLGWIVSEQAIATWNTRADDAPISEKSAASLKESTEDTQVLTDSREKLEADVRESYEAGMPIKAKVLDWLNRQAAITERELCGRCSPYATAKDYLDTIDSLTAERDGLKARVKFQQSQIDASHFAFKTAEEEYDKLDRRCDELKAERDELNTRCNATETERDDLRRITKELEERNSGLLEGREHWIDQAVSIYRRFYPHNEYAVPNDVSSMVIAKIDELTAERDELDEMRERYARALNQVADALGVEITDDAETHAMEMAAIEKLKAERDELREKLDEKQHVIDVQRESFRKIEADCKRLADENECFRKHGTPF